MRMLSIRNLLILVALLLIVNVATWYWFISGMHLRFNAENFNLIVTPITGICATIGFTIALFFSIRQNQILTSQNLKPHFESEIDRIRKVLEALEISAAHKENCNGLTYFSTMRKYIFLIWGNQEYREDLKNHENGTTHPFSYYTSRSYGGELLFFGQQEIVGEYETIQGEFINFLK